jgi:Ala-tRNA(Pro) deacylase
MSIAPTLQRYLTAENIQYDVIPHDPTMSSARTAEACRISGSAKTSRSRGVNAAI